MSSRNHGPRLPPNPSKRARKSSALASGSQLADASGNTQGAAGSAWGAPASAFSNSWPTAVASVGRQLAGQPSSALTTPNVPRPAPMEPSVASASKSREGRFHVPRNTGTWLSQEPDSPMTTSNAQQSGATLARPSAPPPSSTALIQGIPDLPYRATSAEHRPPVPPGSSTPPMIFGQVLHRRPGATLAKPSALAPSSTALSRGVSDLPCGVAGPDHRPPVPSDSSTPPILFGQLLQRREAAPLGRKMPPMREPQRGGQEGSSRAALPAGPALPASRASREGRVPDEPRRLSWGSFRQRERNTEYGPISKTRRAPESRGGADHRPRSEVDHHASRAAGVGPSRGASLQISGGNRSGTSRGIEVRIREAAGAAGPNRAPGPAAGGEATALDKRHPYGNAITHEIISCQTRIWNGVRELSNRGITQERRQVLQRKNHQENCTLKTLEQRQQNLARDIKVIDEMQGAQPGYCAYIKKVERENTNLKSRRSLFQRELGQLAREENTQDNKIAIGQYVRIIKAVSKEIGDESQESCPADTAVAPSGQAQEARSSFGRTTRDTPVRGSAFKAVVAWAQDAEDSDAGLTAAGASGACAGGFRDERSSGGRAPAVTASAAMPFPEVPGSSDSHFHSASTATASTITNPPRATAESERSHLNPVPDSPSEVSDPEQAYAAGTISERRATQLRLLRRGSKGYSDAERLDILRLLDQGKTLAQVHDITGASICTIKNMTRALRERGCPLLKNRIKRRTLLSF